MRGFCTAHIGHAISILPIDADILQYMPSSSKVETLTPPPSSLRLFNLIAFPYCMLPKVLKTPLFEEIVERKNGFKCFQKRKGVYKRDDIVNIHRGIMTLGLKNPKTYPNLRT